MTTIADKLLEYLKTYGDRRIKQYYFGDPLVIPQANMPALIVENKTAMISQEATGMDRMENTFMIKLVMSKKDEIGKNPDEMVLQRTLADIIMKRTSANAYESNSIMGVLRKYFTLGNTIENQQASIEFYVAERGDLITEEAEIIINITDFVNVAVRQ